MTHTELNHQYDRGHVYTIESLTDEGWQFVCSGNDSYPGELARMMDKWSGTPAFAGEVIRLRYDETIVYTV